MPNANETYKVKEAKHWTEVGIAVSSTKSRKQLPNKRKLIIKMTNVAFITKMIL